MKGLFGRSKPKAAPTNSTGKSLADLNNQIEQLEAKIDFQSKQTENLQNEAKEKLKKGDKAGAKKILAKKKRIEANIKQLEGASLMMEEQKMMLENAETMKDIYKTIQTTNVAVKEATGGLNIEQMENVREDMEELKAQQEEMNNFFAEYNQEGQEELDEDLANLEQEIAKEENQLPDANREEIIHQQEPAVKNDEDKELEDFLG